MQNSDSVEEPRNNYMDKAVTDFKATMPCALNLLLQKCMTRAQERWEIECFSDPAQTPRDLVWEAYPVIFLARDK